MLKSFLRARGSQDVSFWEEYFAAQSFEYLVGCFPTDPLRPLFEHYCTGGARVLEGGCGLGNYVACLHTIGARPIGLDFGVDMLRQVRRRVPAAPLAAGDVGALPFADGAFDVYYSGGVMEHFEAGPAPIVREAHRVLRPGGTLLVSVPFANPIRRVRARAGIQDPHLLVQIVDREAPTDPPAGHTFFQYFYRPIEFRQHLQREGFEVLHEQPYSLWRGLTDLRLFRWLDGLYPRRRQAQAVAAGPAGGASPASSPAWKSRLKYWVFAEDRRIPIYGALVSLGCELAANMRMYVCRRR